MLIENGIFIKCVSKDNPSVVICGKVVDKNPLEIIVVDMNNEKRYIKYSLFDIYEIDSFGRVLNILKNDIII